MSYGFDFSSLTDLGSNTMADWNSFDGSSGLGSWGNYLSNSDWISTPISSESSSGGFDWSNLLNSGTAKTALTTGAGLLGNYMSSSAQGNQSQAYADYMTQLSQNQANQSQQALANYEKYLKLLKPTESQKQSYRAAGAKRIWADYDSTNKALSSNLASRNLGGGQLSTGLADNKRQAFSKLGDLETSVEQYGLGSNPSSSAPTTSTATPYPSLSTTDYFTSNLGNLLQYGSGLGASSMFGGNNNSDELNYWKSWAGYA